MTIITDRELDILDEMERTGGSFVKALANACRHADNDNFAKLLNAFPAYFSEYSKRVDARKSKE